MRWREVRWWRCALLLVLLSGHAVLAGAQTPAAPEQPPVELRDLHNVYLMVIRNPVIDARDNGQSLIEAVYRAHENGHSRRYRYTFAVIAKKLNKYINKYQSMNAVERVADADFLVVFNVLEHRNLLGAYYPYGEIYAIINRRPDSPHPPRVAWKARKVLWAEDAAEEFLKTLKAVRGER